MGASRNMNRAMFWRIVRRLISSNPGRLFVILLALGAGASVTAALLNLQVDAKRRLTSEFRAFGPNIIVSPRDSADSSQQGNTLPENYYSDALALTPKLTGKAASLFVIAKANTERLPNPITIVAVGVDQEGDAVDETRFHRQDPTSVSHTEENCWIGPKAASELGAKVGDRVFLKTAVGEVKCHIWAVIGSGGAADNQIGLNLSPVQKLAGLPHRVSVIELRFSGTLREINDQIAWMRDRAPEVDVRPVRQFTEGEAKIYGKISGLLTATVAIVLLLTGLCVMAAMTNIAMERRNDVGLMKAIGGSVRRVLRLFLVEAALLGFAGGAIGAAAGIFLSIGLGKAVFGLAAQPRLIVYPVSVALTMMVAILSAYPLRRLASIKPASVFRGEA
jgi:putative ABC transport system permease protein